MVRHACSTVVWSRLPKASPISGRLIWVRSLASAMATWRGRATLRLRFFECMSDILILKYSATVFWMPSTLTCRLFRLRMSQRFLGEVERQLAPGKAGKREHLFQRPFQLSHVRADVLGNEESNLLGHLDG